MATRLVFASLADIVLVSLLATRGILMSAVPPHLVGALLLAVLAFLVGLDTLKAQIFRRLGVR